MIPTAIAASLSLVLYEVFANPISWDRDRFSYNLAWRPGGGLEIQGQYEHHRENVRNFDFNNDVVAVQSSFSF